MSQITEHILTIHQSNSETTKRVQIQSINSIQYKKYKKQIFQIKKNPIVQRRAFNQNRMILEGSFISRNIQFEVLD